MAVGWKAASLFLKLQTLLHHGITGCHPIEMYVCVLPWPTSLKIRIVASSVRSRGRLVQSTALRSRALRASSGAASRRPRRADGCRGAAAPAWERGALCCSTGEPLPSWMGTGQLVSHRVDPRWPRVSQGTATGCARGGGPRGVGRKHTLLFSCWSSIWMSVSLARSSSLAACRAAKASGLARLLPLLDMVRPRVPLRCCSSGATSSQPPAGREADV